MAGKANITIDHSAIQEQAKQLATTKNELEAVLSSLQTQINNLVQEGFVTDSASGSFQQAHERWNTAAKNCVAELETMASYLNKTSGAFKSVDDEFTVKL